MKSKVQMIILVISVLCICVCLCSCSYGDTHVKAIDDNTLEYKGETYVLLTEDDPYVDILRSHAKQVYVTEAYIPTFLSRLLHEDAIGSLAKSYMSDNEYFIDRNTHGTYCRSDIYSDLEEILTNKEYDVYMYEYHDFKDDQTLSYTLSDDEMAAVDRVFAEVEPIASYDLGYIVESKNHIDIFCFDTETETAGYIHRLLVTDHGYYFPRIREDGVTEYYVVPEELEEIFDGITAEYRKRG
ncbi:MAG: hypothetical protein IKT46_00380 [Clostridia bacterium]|nr:hypothetical protein [Clostridia bacterium]